jgi:hypothetical protein
MQLRLFLVLLAIAAGACSRRPIYGQPTPRDTIRISREPQPDEPNPEPPPK